MKISYLKAADCHKYELLYRYVISRWCQKMYLVKKSRIVCTFLSIYYHIFQLFWLDIKKWAGTDLTVWTSLEFCSSSWKSIRLSKANLVIVSGIFSFAVAGVIHEYGLKWCKDSRLVFHKIEIRYMNIWKIGPTKYALAIPKNLGLGLNFRPCSERYFLSGRP